MTSSVNLTPFFRSALRSFASSSTNFQILRTVPTNRTPLTPRTVYVLDSSFNPPTLSHLQIASDALSSHTGATPCRLLLLLATQNADKAPKPTMFEQRLVMMTLMAENLIQSLSRASAPNGEDNVAIDIGVTKHPFFVDKSAVITSSGVYQPPESQVEQVHLVGFDTLIRVLDPKYYPSHTLAHLNELFTHHRLRVIYRTDDGWGGRQEQDAYLYNLRQGKMEAEGGKREWAEKITFVEGTNKKGGTTSSTKARDAAKEKNQELLANLCIASVKDWILKENLYTHETQK